MNKIVFNNYILKKGIETKKNITVGYKKKRFWRAIKTGATIKC